MATTARESLRELCSDYFHGQIPTAAYRRRRAALLDDIGLGSKPPAEDDEERTQPRPTVTVGELPSVPPNAPQTSAVPHHKLLYAGAAGIVLLLVVLIVFLLTGRSALLHVLMNFQPASVPTIECFTLASARWRHL